MKNTDSKRKKLFYLHPVFFSGLILISFSSFAQSSLLTITDTIVSPISNQPVFSTVMGTCDFNGGLATTNAFNSSESIQAAKLKYTRIGIEPELFLENGIPKPESIDEMVMMLYNEGIQPMLIVEHNPSDGELGSQQKWFDIGAVFATRFRPNSTFLVQNGISNWGITQYSAINEPYYDNVLNFPVSEYLAAIKGFADGVHSVSSTLQVAPGGLQEVPLFINTNPYMDGSNGLAALLKNRTLDALDIHRYFERDHTTYSLRNKVGSHQGLIDLIKSRHNITNDFRVWCTEYNTRKAPNDDENAKDFITATWDLLTVRGNDGNIISDFALAFRTYLPVSSNKNLGMAQSSFPFLGNPKGVAHQMMAHITEGFSMVDANESAGVDILEAVNGDKMWVFHNRVGWSNQTGSTFNITGLPDSAIVLEVFKHDSWNPLVGSTGAPVPAQSIHINGLSSVLVDQLNTGETYMFVAKNSPSNDDMPAVSFSLPNNSSTFSEGDAITISATASDADGIAEVVFYAGPVRLGELSSAPYTVDWTNVPAGTTTLRAIAKDNNGAVRMVEKQVFVEHPSGTNLIVGADAYVKGRQTANDNFGSSPSLFIKTASNDNLKRRIFLKFDVSGLANIQSAILRLRVGKSGEATHSIYAVPDAEDNWSESGITWINEPTYPTLITSKTVAAEGQWMDFDITNHVINEVSGNGTLSLAIWTGSTAFVEYFSKESSSGNEPRIVINPSRN